MPPAAPARRDERLLAALLAALLVLLAAAFGVFEVLGFARFVWPTLAVASAVAALVAGRRTLRVLRLLALLGAMLIGVVAYTPLTRTLVRPLVRTDAIPPVAHDAIVVLAAWVDRDGHLNAAALDRLLTGATLHRRGVAARLILSRVSNDGRSTDEDQRRVLALLGDSVAVTIIDSVFATRDEAVRAAALRPPVRRIAVVTSPLHTRRACAAYEKVGFVVTCVPSESRDLPLRSLDRAEPRVRAFQQWLYETLATAWYRRNGWI
jgi:uncharacterized SAM-binding protein YcdF (DUF218 family)